MSGEFTRVVDEVTTKGDADMVGVFFFRVVVNYNAGICDGEVCWNVFIPEWSREKIGLVPAVPVVSSPCAMPYSSFPKSVIQVLCMMGSLDSTSYLLMV